MIRLLPEISSRTAALRDADTRFDDLYSEHRDAAISEHACGYDDGQDSCETCDDHSRACPRCQELLDALMGLHCLEDNAPHWADEVERARLSRMAHEVLLEAA